MPQSLATPQPQSGAVDGKRERLRQLIKTLSFLSGGGFKLASGRQTNYYFDMKKTMFHPEGMSLIADLVYDAVKGDTEVEQIGGLEVGAIPLVAAVAMRSHLGRPLHGFFVRKEPKDHGTRRSIDGRFEPGKPAILFDDITTTGGSVMKAVAAVREQNCSVKKIVTIVDRLEGARENLQKEGIELVALFVTSDFTG